MAVPLTWVPHRRAHDRELVGYLDPVDEEWTAVVPRTVFGYPLSAPLDYVDAEAVLESSGLAVLAERWLMTTEEGEEIAVRIVEATVDRVLLTTSDISREGRYGIADLSLQVPEEIDRLRLQANLG